MNRTSNSRPSIEHLPRELDSRSSDGIEVRLLWDPQDSRVSVSVNDSKTGESFELQVRHGDRALDVFHHPYAYSALANPRAVRGRGQQQPVRLPGKDGR